MSVLGVAFMDGWSWMSGVAASEDLSRRSNDKGVLHMVRGSRLRIIGASLIGGFILSLNGFTT